ncbi:MULTISPECIES: universal stress protein [Haloarcula]|uniref:Universal stress protein n=1 Tax=Haloarcula marismortui ATCC 33799 TaxID=662475 RepID=M0KN60_9EURY|nr:MULTISPECIES: universal stress protein [Haloarcula]EMA21569.1 universal stress protein [Haloarcula californiae ATCC 33799]NHN62555.1 universal stress protein [Haloarcula sp. JP-Z28]NHX40972.1 universal stress protein [Haloarcula sp. R1-2]
MTDRLSILVPIRVLEGESVPEGVPELLAHAHVVLLGYHVIPEQTAPGQARMQFEDRATERLDEYQEMFEDAGATVERRLVFTHNGQKTIDRMIAEHDCMAVLVPNATGPVEDVLVPVRGAIGVDRLARVVASVFGEMDADVTLYHVADEDTTDDDIQTLLGGLADRLAEFGMDPSTIETRIDRDQNPFDAIVDVSDGFDTVVMGETDPSLATFVFGMPADQVANRFLGPVFVAQRERPSADEDE